MSYIHRLYDNPSINETVSLFDKKEEKNSRFKKQNLIKLHSFSVIL